MVFLPLSTLWWIESFPLGFCYVRLNLWRWEHSVYVLWWYICGDNGMFYWFTWCMFWYSTRGFPRWHWGNLCIGVDARFCPTFSNKNFWSDSLLHVEGLPYELIMLSLLREFALVKVWTLGLVSKHCNTVFAHFYHLLPCFLYFSDNKNLYLPSIWYVYRHLFAELVHLYNLPLYWECWRHKRLFVIWFQGCLKETIFILRLPRIDKP